MPFLQANLGREFNDGPSKLKLQISYYMILKHIQPYSWNACLKQVTWFRNDVPVEHVRLEVRSVRVAVLMRPSSLKISPALMAERAQHQEVVKQAKRGLVKTDSRPKPSMCMEYLRAFTACTNLISVENIPYICILSNSHRKPWRLHFRTEGDQCPPHITYEDMECCDIGLLLTVLSC